jgi:hypothetical protein
MFVSSLTALPRPPRRDIHSDTRFRFSESSTERAGRSRAKGFNPLKTEGYNLEYSFGHSKQRLPAALAILNLLRSAPGTVAELTHEPGCRLSARYDRPVASLNFFERPR